MEIKQFFLPLLLLPLPLPLPLPLLQPLPQLLTLLLPLPLPLPQLLPLLLPLPLPLPNPCLRADVSYFLCGTRKRDVVPFPWATKKIGDVCTQATESQIFNTLLRCGGCTLSRILIEHGISPL